MHRDRFVRSIVLGCGLLVAATTAHGNPGDMDFSFAGFGPFGQLTVHEDVAYHALQPDGKVVLVGFSGVALSVTRRLENGDLDVGFGNGGTAIVTNLAYFARPRSVALQPDGKIVVAGYALAGNTDLMVARVTASGAADPTFSGDGFVTISFSTDSDVAEKVLIQPDGKIVVAGRSFIGGDWDFAAARFLPDGTLDNTFSGDGKATVGFGGDDQCWDAVLQADGKLVMVGGSIDGIFADGDFAIARLNTNGTQDISFDHDGEVTTGFTANDEARAVAIQADLRIVVAGNEHMSRYYSSDGSLDDSFDGDGKLSIGTLNAYDLAITPGGKLVILGVANGQAYFSQRLANGSFDTGFSGNGTQEIGIPDNSLGLEPPGLSLLPDGRLLGVIPRGGECDLARMWPISWDFGGRQTDGLSDATFPAGSQEVGHAMAVQPDGKIVVAGQVSTVNNTETDIIVTRFTASGLLDPTFGTAGHATLSLTNTDIAKAVAIQPDGKIVVAGYTGTGTAVNFMVARFNANGTLDDTFGFFGYNILNFLNSYDYGHAIALQPDGKIVVAGPVYTGSEWVFGVARFTVDGFVDNTFSGDGKTTYNFSASTTDWATAVVVQGGNRIIVGGFTNDDFALVALTLSGGVDASFAGAGQTVINMGGFDYLYALTISPDNWIYAAGVRDIGGNGDFAILRLTANGLIQFCPVGGCAWPGGKVFRDWGSSYGTALAIDVRSDGEIVVAGNVGGVYMGWVEYSSSHPNLVAAGIADFPGNEEATAVKFVGTNKVVLAGYHNFANDRNLALARFEVTQSASVEVGDRPWIGAPTARFQTAIPNPFTRQMTLAFELQHAQPVRIVLYDAAGRAVRTLANETLPAGRHQRIWDGSDENGRQVAAGVYFAQLVAGTDLDRKKVVVLR